MHYTVSNWKRILIKCLIRFSIKKNCLTSFITNQKLNQLLNLIMTKDQLLSLVRVGKKLKNFIQCYWHIHNFPTTYFIKIYKIS